MSKRYTKEEFAEKANVVHNNKYDYSKVEYVNSQTKVCIICPIHGEFWQQPDSHLQKHGCPKCRSDKISELERFNNDIFTAKAREVHGDKYDYSRVNYIDMRTPVCIICPYHGEFWQRPSDHVRGHGCAACSGTKKSNRDEFEKKSRKVHGLLYDYSKVIYINDYTKVEIICPEHGSFWQKPNCHLNGNGCPMCKSSRGERLVKSYLDIHSIEHKSHYKIEVQQKLFSRNNFLVDFYLPKHNTIIEVNGIQHYQFMPFFHRSEDAFAQQVDRDKRLKEYCKKSKIKLIIIKYDEIDKIESILNKKLKNVEQRLKQNKDETA